MTASGISQSGALAPDTGKAKSAASSIFDLLDQKSKILSADDSGTTVENMMGDIEFHNVSFKYPSRPNVPVFTNLCLVIPFGKVQIFFLAHAYISWVPIYIIFCPTLF